MNKEQLIAEITSKLAEVQQVASGNKEVETKVSEVEHLLQQLRQV